jgi:prephenate dehydrogenase
VGSILTEPPFQRIAIAGLGLIGGSIALAVRDRWPSARVIGVDTGPVLAHAMGSGAIERAVNRVSDLPPVDLLVLAAPVRQNLALLTEVGAAAAPGTIVTDVGGTKRAIVDAARALPANVTFVGGHPLGGGERGGFAFARPDLFVGRPWIFTPENSPADAVARLDRFASGLGSTCATMDPDAHDRLMAFVSHLPQMAASALMAVVGGAAQPDGLRMAGRGLLDTTRLASSPADVWRDIAATNADRIGEALDLLIAELTRLRTDLSRGEALQDVFDHASRWRAELMKGME